MRKMIGIVVASALLSGALFAPVHAGKKGNDRTTVRTASYEFDPSQGGLTAWFGEDYGLFFGDPAILPSKKGEVYVDLEIADDSGAPITAAVWQEDGDTTVICNATSAPIDIMGGAAVHVQVFFDLTPAAFAGCETPSMPTTGTVTATFHAPGHVAKPPKSHHDH